MASAAQIAANQANAQLSTGPRTPEGKAAVARNRTTHGLSSPGFFLLPGEDPQEFAVLLASYHEEHQPDGPTESFLVNELAHCQWKLRRVAAMEAGLLGADDPHSSPDELMQADLAGPQRLLKLGRYEARIRRDWYRALSELRALRREVARAVTADARLRQAEADAEFNRMLQEIDKPISFPSAASAQATPARPEPTPANHSKPIPQPAQPELAAHPHPNPLFDALPGRGAGGPSTPGAAL
jgi:hypothetical protein